MNVPGAGLAGRQALIRAGMDEELLPRGGVVVGSAGSGKTTVLRAVSQRAAGTTITLSGLGGSAALVFGPLLAADDLSAGRLRWALATALKRRRDELVMIDDADLLDDEAAALLHSLVVHEAIPILLACTVETIRPGPARLPAGIRALWKDGHLPRFDLRPIDHAELADHLHAELGVPPTGRDVERLARWCGGDLAALTGLVAGSIREGNWQTVQGVAVLAEHPRPTPALREQAAATLAALPATVVEVLELFAAAESAVGDRTAGWLPLATLNAVCGFEVLVEAERFGVLESDGAETDTGRVRLTTPFLADVIAEGLPALRRSLLTGRLRDAAAQPDPVDSDRSAVLRGLLSLSAPPGSAPVDLLSAARSALRLGDPEAVVVLVGGRTAEPEAAALTAWALLHRGDIGGFQRIAAGRRDDRAPQLRGLAEFTGWARQWLSAGPQAVLRHWDQVPGGLVGAAAGYVAADHRSGAWFGLLAACTALSAGRFTQTRELLTAIAPAAAGDGLLTGYLSIVDAQLDSVLAGGRRACRRSEQARADIGWRGDQLWATADFGCALVHLAVGRFEEAIAELRSCTPFLASTQWREAAAHLLERAQLMSTGTRTVVAETSAEEVAGALPIGLLLPAAGAAGVSRAWAVAADDPDAAVDALLSSAGTLAESAPVSALEQLENAVRFLPPQSSRRASRVDAAVVSVGQTVEPCDRIALLRSYSAAVAAGCGAALEAVAERYRIFGLIPVAADAHAQASGAFRAAGDERSAVRNATAAQRLVATMEGLHSPAQRRMVLPVLTRREEQVAALVARELTNREIAERLHLSVRTVEGHLLRAGTKTGLRTREELAEYWRERTS